MAERKVKMIVDGPKRHCSECTNGFIDVTRAKGSAPVHGEGAFYYELKLALQALGHDVIRKRMWKDGHMVSEEQLYIRERKWRWVAWDHNYVIHDIAKEYNAGLTVVLSVGFANGDSTPL